MLKRKGLFAAWIAMCGFTFSGCTIESSDDDDSEQTDDDSADDDSADDDSADDDSADDDSADDDSADDDSADDDSADDDSADDDSGSGGAGGAGGTENGGQAGDGDEGGSAGDSENGGASGSAGDSGTAGEGGSGGTSGSVVQGGGGNAGAAGQATAGTAGGGGAENGGATNQAGAGGAAVDPAKSDLVQIEGATFIEGGRPETTGDQTGPGLEAPDFVINGGTGEYTVTIPNGAVSIVIGVEGDNGYFVIPVTGSAATTGFQKVPITLLQGYTSNTLGVLVATVNENDQVSAWTSNTVDVVETATGDLKVSLSMNQAEDLDLWVTDPSGVKIYYGNPTQNGSNLDLDSNAGCSTNMGVNNENITWEGTGVLSGEYLVQVDYYANCGAEAVDYIVTVTIGEDVRTYEGTFVAADEASETARTQTVLTFTYNN